MITLDSMSAAEQDMETYYDAYKSIHGIKPRWLNLDEFQDAEKVQQMFAELKVIGEQVSAHEAQVEKLCVSKFEEFVTQTMQIGKTNRKTALTWIMDGSNCQGDWDFLCYEHGLPYKYFKEMM